MHHHNFPKLFPKAHARKSRGGNTTYATGEQGNYKFHDKPQFKNHEPSSHLMADDNKNNAWASIYRDESGSWSNQNYDQAVERKEVYSFKGKNARNKMIEFARKGNWKK